MASQIDRRRWIQWAIAASVSTTVGCGTLLHPERRNQPAGRLDWGVVVLDALGLLFFFIPGIIAFAVDFSTGAIYLPPECPPGVPLTLGPLQKVETHPKPSIPEVERIVSEHTKQPIKLTPGNYFTEPLKDLGEFWSMHKRFV